MPTDDAQAGVPDQIYTIFIRASAEAVWGAITQPAFSARYFYGAKVETTAVEGGPFRYHAPDGESLWGDETVLEAEPPRRLVVTWRSLYDDELAGEPASRVTWDIDEQEGGVTLLTVTHDRLAQSPKTAASVSGPGWMMVLSGLKSVLETGSGLRG
jgi:uncharacterized protein YndB with AHSA1/START domain